jgi:DNA-binding phage protein
MAKPSRTLKVYKSYNFVDKDPIIDYARTRVFTHGGIGKVAAASGVTPTTLYNWFHKKTRCPQFATVARVLIACGESVIDLRAVQRAPKRSNVRVIKGGKG